MEFELYRLKNWGGRPNKACFPEGFPPTTRPHCPSPEKTWSVVSYVLPRSEGAVVPHLPPISLHKSIKNQTIYETTLPLSNLVDQVIQVKLMTGWWRGC